MISKKSLTAALILSGSFGCATVAPPSLVEARDLYAKSSQGAAARYTPTDLYEAKKTLDKANQEFDEHGDSQETRDWAYIAKNKIDLANVKARTEISRQQIAATGKAGLATRDAQVQNAQTALANTREQLGAERRQNETTSKELEAEKAGHETEKAARMSAEGKLAGAMKDLADIAAVKQEPRGVVITLSGGVLFASGKHALLNTAQTKLDQVAEALKAQDSDKRIVVEGHTDSQGSDSTNQRLSEDRATAVRDYLVSRGVPADKVTSQGLGKTRPLVDNNTPENRANNRRVEIVIANASGGKP